MVDSARQTAKKAGCRVDEAADDKPVWGGLDEGVWMAWWREKRAKITRPGPKCLSREADDGCNGKGRGTRPARTDWV